MLLWLNICAVIMLGRVHCAVFKKSLKITGKYINSVVLNFMHPPQVTLLGQHHKLYLLFVLDVSYLNLFENKLIMIIGYINK